VIRRKPKADPVTPDLHEAVLVRDLRFAGGCVARFLDPTHKCADRWGQSHRPDDEYVLTLDHVQESYGRMGKRAPSDKAHLVTLCYHAHLLGWATRNRPLLREYLTRANDAGCGHVEPMHGCPGPCNRADPFQLVETVG
jgi:hypothetical protein